MTQLDAPLKIVFDYVVETVSNTGDIMESHHYTTYDEAYERFENVKSKDTLILLSLYTIIKRVIENDEVHKLVLARNK